MTEPAPPDDLDRLWQTQETPKMEIALDTIVTDASRFQRGVRNRNLREYLASVVVLAVFGWMAMRPDEPLLVRVASLLLVAGGVVMVTHLHLRGHAAQVPAPSVSTRELLAWHRGELVRQRDLCRRVPVWYVGPIVPGVVLFLVAGMMRTPQRPLVMVGVVVVALATLAGILVANRRAARSLDERIAALPPDDDLT